MELGIYLHESSFLVKALGVTAILAVGAAVLGTVVVAFWRCCA